MFDSDELLSLVQPQAEQRSDRKTPTERLDVFLNTTIKQIVLYLPNDMYDNVVDRLTRLRNRDNIDNHTQLFLKMLAHYEATSGPSKLGGELDE